MNPPPLQFSFGCWQSMAHSVLCLDSYEAMLYAKLEGAEFNWFGCWAVLQSLLETAIGVHPYSHYLHFPGLSGSGSWDPTGTYAASEVSCVRMCPPGWQLMSTGVQGDARAKQNCVCHVHNAAFSSSASLSSQNHCIYTTYFVLKDQRTFKWLGFSGERF